ncbi:hypothetical protein [Conexibacter arvalis]|uniref:Uncharacterized protein n=1 Tax=Conexibacter arvalis TaxID=912552 RepID=A0A840IMP3_9ACTN|nr:hypothetical protein [Conexibacter arvalis]MBB4665264.1 hypothetical protein [Conexibacter arvalis]
MARDPFGNELPKPPPAPGVRLLRRIGIAEIALGLILLIAGFAIGEPVVALIGGVIVASSGTLFVFAHSLNRRT